MRTFARLGACLVLSACARSHVVAARSDAGGEAAREAGATREAGADASENMVAGDAGEDMAGDDAGGGVVREDAGTPSRGLARNVIVFLGDGMGYEQLTTGRYAKGGTLRVDSMRGPAFANTDSASGSVTDSAAAATVIASGVRVRNGVVSQVEDGAPLETVLEVCQRAGKATGIVTTSYFYDASPAAFSAHAESRGDYAELIAQMLTVTRPDVIMGGENLVGLAQRDPDYDLAAAIAATDYFVVRGSDELEAWDPLAQPRMIGLFATDFAPSTPGGEPFTSTPVSERRHDSPDPTLKTMTARALDRLGTDPEGFFLFAEDETFDQIGHRSELPWSNVAYPAQAAAFDDAVGVAIDWVLRNSSFAETLIVVLADHDTGGYQFDHQLGPESGRFEEPRRHTRTPIPVFVLGPGQEAIEAIDEHADTHRLLVGDVP